MRSLKKYYMTVLFILILALGCNTTDQRNSSNIPPGFYAQQAQRTLVGDSEFSASTSGGFFNRSFQFFEGDSLRIEVKSDIPDENGVARATYAVTGQELNITTRSSTTSVYDSGSNITFDPIETVDDSFTETFPDGSKQFIFRGPGLLLHSQQSDQDDLDRDGNTNETVDQTLFLKQRVVLFD